MHKRCRFCQISLTLSEIIRIVDSLSTVVTNLCAYLLRNQTQRFTKRKLLLTLRITFYLLPKCESLSRVGIGTEKYIYRPHKKPLRLDLNWS